MKLVLIGLLALTSNLSFAGEDSSFTSGGCWVGYKTTCKWGFDNCITKYAVYNYDSVRLSDYFNEPKSAIHEMSKMRKEGLCHFND